MTGVDVELGTNPSWITVKTLVLINVWGSSQWLRAVLLDAATSHSLSVQQESIHDSVINRAL